GRPNMCIKMVFIMPISHPSAMLKLPEFLTGLQMQHRRRMQFLGQPVGVLRVPGTGRSRSSALTHRSELPSLPLNVIAKRRIPAGGGGTRMPQLTAKTRAQLRNAAFAYIDAKGRRRLPIHDEAHVRNALARFNQTRFEDDAARERARKKLLT